MPKSPTVLDFERTYLERARACLETAGTVRAAIADRGERLPREATPAIGGWWCRPETPGLVVLPNPWDDREAIGIYDERAWKLATAALCQLGARLNALHGVEEPGEYWDLLLAPWMLIVAAVVLDRHLYCATLHELNLDVPVLAAAPPAPPPTLAAAVGAMRSESFNRALIGELARRLGHPVEPVTERGPQTPDTRRRGSQARPKLLWLLANPQIAGAALARSVLSGKRARRLALVGQVDVSSAQLFALARAVPGLRVAPRPALPGEPAPDLNGAPGEHPGRPTLGGQGGGDSPEAALDALLPLLVPRSIVEGYDVLIAESRRRFGPPAHVLHGNYSWEDLQNEFLARSVRAGRRLAFVQHGGCALQLQVAPGERHERRPGSARLTWGGLDPGAVPLPSPYIQRLANTHRGGEMTVIVEHIVPPDTYVVRFSTVPLGNQSFREAERLERCVRLCGPITRPSLVLKRFPFAPTNAARSPVLEALTVPSRLARRPATEWMRIARVVLVPYPDTPFIEAMAIGVPIIGLWDPELWGMRSDAAPYFARLAELGVVHTEPANAAAQLENIYENADAWWGSAPIQEARRAFLDRFARVGDWRTAWTRVLRGLADEI
jgi:hypothetical protein